MITRDALAWPPARSRAALRSENAITSAGCGRIRMSLSDGSSASSTRPSRLAPTSASTIGALVCSRSAATSCAIAESMPATWRTTSTLSIGVRLSAALR